MERLQYFALQAVYEKYRLQVRTLGYSASVGGTIYGTRLERKQNREEAHVVQCKKFHLFQVDICDPQKAYQNGYISLLDKKKPGTTFALKRVDLLGDASGIALWHSIAHLSVKYSEQYSVQSLPADQKDKSLWNFYTPASDELHGLATKILVKNMTAAKAWIISWNWSYHEGMHLTHHQIVIRFNHYVLYFPCIGAQPMSYHLSRVHRFIGFLRSCFLWFGGFAGKRRDFVLLRWQRRMCFGDLVCSQCDEEPDRAGLPEVSFDAFQHGVLQPGSLPLGRSLDDYFFWCSKISKLCIEFLGLDSTYRKGRTWATVQIATQRSFSTKKIVCAICL